MKRLWLARRGVGLVALVGGIAAGCNADAGTALDLHKLADGGKLPIDGLWTFTSATPQASPFREDTVRIEKGRAVFTNPELSQGRALPAQISHFGNNHYHAHTLNALNPSLPASTVLLVISHDVIAEVAVAQQDGVAEGNVVNVFRRVSLADSALFFAQHPFRPTLEPVAEPTVQVDTSLTQVLVETHASEYEVDPGSSASFTIERTISSDITSEHGVISEDLRSRETSVRLDLPLIKIEPAVARQIRTEVERRFGTVLRSQQRVSSSITLDNLNGDRTRYWSISWRDRVASGTLRVQGADGREIRVPFRVLVSTSLTARDRTAQLTDSTAVAAVPDETM